VLKGGKVVLCHDVASAAWRPWAASAARRKGTRTGAGMLQKVKRGEERPEARGQSGGGPVGSVEGRRTHARQVLDTASAFRAGPFATNRKNTRARSCLVTTQDT
jgi:hypothetical protein